MKRSYRAYQDISVNTSANTHSQLVALIEKTKKAKVVDIPCGAGALVSRLVTHGYEDILAIDINNTLEIEHSNFMRGDMNKPLPIENNVVDALLCCDGIEHISRQFSFVREVNRVLKDSGEFIISTPNISSLRSRWRWLLTGHHNKCKSPLNENEPDPSHHISMISYPELRYMLHSNGFKIQKVMANRIKTISWVYAILVPFAYLITSWVYFTAGRKEKTSNINKEIKKVMFSLPVLLGETIILKATKIKSV